MTEQQKIEAIVKQVLAGMQGNASVATSGPSIPKTSRVALLTEKEHFEIKEYPKKWFAKFYTGQCSLVR